MSLADLNTYKVYYCCFDGGNLQVIDMEEDLKITIGQETDTRYILFMKVGVRCILHHQNSLVESTYFVKAGEVSYPLQQQ